MFLYPRDLQLPLRTRLVLDQYISFEEFAQFTHFTALESLSITMRDPIWTGDNPQDLDALKTLPNLTSLRVDRWLLQGTQDIASLTTLTKLSLTNLFPEVREVYEIVISADA